VLFVAFVVFIPFQATPDPDFPPTTPVASLFTHRVNTMTATEIPNVLEHQDDGRA